MNEPKWIRLELALLAHEKQLSRHGGISGVRDRGLLESAMTRPKNIFAYMSAADVATLAASYANGIIRNHPFLDGNKRTGWAVARTFLLINGWSVNATQDEKADTVLQLAATQISEEEFADWLRQRLVRREAPESNE